MILYMIVSSDAWLLLIVSLPTASATARMRIWRSVKSLGCAALRDGAYLLPGGAVRAQALKALVDECLREAGTAWLMAVQPCASDEAAAWCQLFDRQEDFAALLKAWKAARRGLASLPAPELARLQRKLQRELDALLAVDFFPGAASADARAAWVEFNQRIASLLSLREPQRAKGRIPVLDPREYQGRTWATRRHLWVDRVASAWLIRRFIDPAARFKWLATPADCPKRALGFDFDGATFTHVADQVTFEVLLASFGLRADPALARLAALVHALDVGGDAVPEAAGLEAVMAGARERLRNDDALLSEMSQVLDSLYAHFQSATQLPRLTSRNAVRTQPGATP